MFKKITHVLMALTMALGMTFASAPKAEARHGGIGLGIAAGIIGLGVLGAAASAHDYDGPRYYSRYREEDRCYYGERECHWTGRRCFENRYGDEVCRGGRYVCERSLVCD